MAFRKQHPSAKRIFKVSGIDALAEAKLIYNWYSKKDIQKLDLNENAKNTIAFSGRNHYPFNSLTDKASLVSKFQGKEYFPESYVLQVKNGCYHFPVEFMKSFETSKSDWIAKAPLGSLGSNIELISSKTSLKGLNQRLNKKFNEISEKDKVKRMKSFRTLNDKKRVKKRMRTVVISKYIADPALFDGKKFDVRAYLLIARAKKPVVAFYHPGHGRVCGKEYSSDLEDKSIHITNQAFQNDSSLLKSWQECIDKIDFDERDIEVRICGIFSDTLKCVDREIENNANRFPKLSEFYLFGVDFMITQSGKVKLIEFNARPSMKSIQEKNPKLVSEMTQLVLGGKIPKNSRWVALNRGEF